MQIPSDADFPILREIYEERDRGAAIIAAGFLEAKLTEVIRVCFRDDEDAAEELLRPTGPLGAFGSKVRLEYLLRLYRKESRDDMALIARIRNRFAHTPEPIDFGDASIRQRCQKLTLFERVWGVIPTMEIPKPPFDRAKEAVP